MCPCECETRLSDLSTDGERFHLEAPCVVVVRDNCNDQTQTTATAHTLSASSFVFSYIWDPLCRVFVRAYRPFRPGFGLEGWRFTVMVEVRVRQQSLCECVCVFTTKLKPEVSSFQSQVSVQRSALKGSWEIVALPCAQRRSPPPPLLYIRTASLF